jgi:plasmid stabilization system protein ParE
MKTMKLVVHPAAQKEFDRKVDYLRKNGLLPDAADLFVDEIGRALDLIQNDSSKGRTVGMRGLYRVGPTARFS